MYCNSNGIYNEGKVIFVLQTCLVCIFLLLFQMLQVLDLEAVCDYCLGITNAVSDSTVLSWMYSSPSQLEISAEYDSLGKKRIEGGSTVLLYLDILKTDITLFNTGTIFSM